MKILFGLLLFSVSLFSVAFMVQEQTAHPAYRSLCLLVSQNYYKKDYKLSRWKRGCDQRAQNFQFRKKQELVDRLHQELNLLGGSHLEIYAPIEHSRIWDGSSGGDTGIRARFIEGELVVYKIIPDSPAELAGIKVGDTLVSINGEHPDVGSAQKLSGRFEIRSQSDQVFELKIDPQTLEIDEAPSLTTLEAGIAHLEVPSFRGELFEEAQVEELSQALIEHSGGVILDLRDNLGGNLVAGMRLLGVLLCQQAEVGRLLKNRTGKALPPEALLNELSDRAQLAQIADLSEVSLQSYPPSNCVKRPLVVLVDHGSSSTSEIVASALREHAGALLLGTPTAGQVLIAVWYDFSELGEGYSLSIPERRFVSSSGEELEGVGLYPDRTLYYKLAEARRQQDSWLLRAKEALQEEQ